MQDSSAGAGAGYEQALGEYKNGGGGGKNGAKGGGKPSKGTKSTIKKQANKSGSKVCFIRANVYKFFACEALCANAFAVWSHVRLLVYLRMCDSCVTGQQADMHVYACRSQQVPPSQVG